VNPFAAASDTVKLVSSVVGLVLLALALWWASTFFTAKATLKEIKAADARITRANAVNNAEAKTRDRETDALTTATEQQARALAKALDNDKSDFDAASRAEYFRVLNRALRGRE